MGNDIIAGPTLLYVDDQPSHLALFKRAFDRDYRVILAASGEEGIEIIKKNKIFLAIADHNMPRMSGVDFLERVKEITPRTEQALLSAYTDEKILKEASARTKVSELLKKPWKRDSMKTFIESAFERYEREPTNRIPDKIPVPILRSMPLLLEQLKESIDPAGARRVFLNHIEPPLKKFIPPIRRPAPELLRQAHEEALKGNFEGVERALTSYLQTLTENSSSNPDNPALQVLN